MCIRDRYQAEGYAFWKTMEAYAAPHMHDGCDNSVLNSVMLMGEINASTCDAFIWAQHDAEDDDDYMCYNTVTHSVSSEATTEEECAGYSADGYMDNYAAKMMNDVLDLTDASQLGTSYDVAPWLQPVWDYYGITSDDIGSMS